jgi:electron transfer flavoprotein alpha subunit
VKDCRVISCINYHEKVRIFPIADYSLVADLSDAVPELDESVV